MNPQESSSSRIKEIFNILLREPDSQNRFAQDAIKELSSMDTGVVENEIFQLIRSTATFKSKKIPIPLPIPVPIFDLLLIPRVRFGKGEVEVWSSTAYLLSLIRDLSLRPLLQSIVDSDGMVSYYATALLKFLGEKRAVPFLIQALRSPYANIRLNAVRALGELGDKAAVPHLIKTAQEWWNVYLLIDKASFSFKKANQAVKDIGIDESRGCESSDYLKSDALRALVQLGCEPKDIIPYFSSFSTSPNIHWEIVHTLTQTSVFDKIPLVSFNEFLNANGFISKIMESGVKNPTKGVLNLENSSINYIIKDVGDDVAKLSFVIEDIGKKIEPLVLKYKEDSNDPGKVKEIRWESKNWQLASELNNQKVREKLLHGISYGNLYRSSTYMGRNFINVEGTRVLETTDYAVTLRHGFYRLPPKEYFEAMEEVGYCIRKFG